MDSAPRGLGDEKIEVEATMIGLESMDSAAGDNICLSITISNAKHSDDSPLVFDCFINPHKISIDNVFIPLPSRPKPYSGPSSSKMSEELRTALEDFCKERDIDDNFSAVLPAVELGDCFEKELYRMLLDGKDSKVTFSDFPFYVRRKQAMMQEQVMLILQRTLNSQVQLKILEEELNHQGISLMLKPS